MNDHAASAHSHGSHGHGHGHGDHDHGADEGLRELLDLDAEITRDELAALTARIADLAGDHPVRDIIDIGSGTGTGTFALLRRFPDAVSTVVDTSDDMLSHLTTTARGHGLDARIRPLRADLDAAWPAAPDSADLIWASSSLHHMADPDRVLRDIHATLRPGGVLAVVEMADMPRFLPEDLGFGTPGLEERCHAAMEKTRAEHVPHIRSDWTSRLTAAGFTVDSHRTLDVSIPAPLPPAARRYAAATLGRFRHGLVDTLAPEDRATLDTLLDGDEPLSLRHRADLSLTSSRDVWLLTR
ncbi:class I SAM-dependent methyltransferase [Actinoplanes rectilineatus]|uniref:class I SAM-dependent methyltransferase n=1 Tax=Actinoplanes rectilineatus TaxID=113571 RepID=UPI0005F2E0C4|nr:class I SAM-dependent methyltransferase [Actinoplanes rectilineatus]